MSVTPQKILIYGTAFVGGLIAALYVFRVPTVALSTDVLSAARQRWNSAGISDYDLDYLMHGMKYHVQVRQNIVTTARIDGQELHSAELGLYSMDGLFSLLAMELENAEDARPPPTLRVKFNAKHGHLERYIRGGSGLGRGTSIEVYELTPVESSAGL